MSTRTRVIDWPAGEGITIGADNEPYLAGTDWPIRNVRGHHLPEMQDTLTWLRESYDDARRVLLVTVAPEPGPPTRFTPEEREWVIDSVASSQQLAGVPVTRDEVARILDEGDELAPVAALDWISAAARGE